MNRQYARRRASWVSLGPNARTDLGDESQARALARSRAKCQINPLIFAVNEAGGSSDAAATLVGLDGGWGSAYFDLCGVGTDKEAQATTLKAPRAAKSLERLGFFATTSYAAPSCHDCLKSGPRPV